MKEIVMKKQKQYVSAVESLCVINMRGHDANGEVNDLLI